MRSNSRFHNLAIVAAAIVVVGVVSWAAISSIAAAVAPSGFTATAGDTQVTLTWNDPGDDDITGYQVLSVGISKLVVPDTATDPIGADDRFGDAVGVDNRRAAVGAPFQDTGGESNVGQVHMFSRGSGGWSHLTQRAFIAASADDNTGASVAVDGRTVVAGVPEYDYPESNSVTHFDIGRMIVYYDDPGLGWGYTEDPNGEAAGDQFGNSVSVDSGIAVVGAPNTDVLTPVAKGNVGTAYVYTRNSDDLYANWTKRATLTASDRDANDRFGWAVAVEGDTIVVGAEGETNNRGAAYVLVKPAGNWATDTESAKLTAPDGATDDAFGSTVAVDGDFIVVGARGDDDVASQSGSVYVFTKPNTTDGWGDWDGLSSTAKDALTAKLTASDAAMNDRLGWSVAVDGDTVLAGAYLEDDKGANSGSVYLFTKPSGAWATATETVKLTAPDGAAGDEFGYSVAAGGGTAIVGAPGDESETGAAYVFSIPQWTDISVSDDGATISHTATGLDNGVEHTFLIRPVVGSNPGPKSGNIKATPQQSPAAAPTGLSALGGDAQVTLSWNDPNDSTITAYKFQQKEGSGTFGSWMTIPTSGYGQANTTGYTVTGLDNGKTYTFRIRAVDEAGDSTASNQGSASTLPAAPANLVAAASDGQVTLSWDDPDNNSITIYQYSTNGGTNYTDIALADIDSTSDPGTMKYTVTALDNGSTYTFAVRAVNNTGNGGAATLTVAMVPPAPPGLTATGGDGQVALSWNDPNDTGITGYQYSTDDGTSYTAFALAAIDFSETGKFKYTIKNLPNGVTYNLALRAVNASGNGGVATATALMVPAAPANLTARPRDQRVQLSWDDPGNASITKYELWLHAESATLTAANAVLDDEFGNSLAVVGDTAMVGMPGDDDTHENSGAVLVFTRNSNGDWNQAAKLKAGDAAEDDEFGSSVAFDGDTIVVGAPFDDDNGGNSGSAYVFTKSNGDWGNAPPSGDHRVETAKLTAPDGAADDEFGWNAVAVDGDTIVVGAYADDSYKGAVYVFSKPTGGWGAWNDLPQTGANDQVEDKDGLTAKLTAENAEDGDYFGHSVAVDGDTIVVGANGDDGTSTQFKGSAFVFVKPESGGWVSTNIAAKLTASARGNQDNFGRSVAIDSDTVVVGADGYDSNMGSAFVFSKPASGWADSGDPAQLTAAVRGANDRFGFSVAVDSDTVLVGAYGEGSSRGSTYAFTKPDTGWADGNETARLTASDRARNHQFGTSVTIDGNIVVVGAVNAAGGNGAAYVFDIKGWDDIPDSGETTTFHAVTGLTNNITYTFAVRAVNPSGDGPASTASATPMPAPAAPVILSATPRDGQVALTWDDPEDDTITKYQYSTDYIINGGGNSNNGGASFSDIPSSNKGTIKFTVTGLANGTTHTLAVRAVNAYGNGVTSAVTALMIPAAPRLSATAGDAQVALSWADPGNATIENYQVFRVEEPGALEPSPSDDDFFGHSVAVDGDTAVIGAYKDAQEPGPVYVFTRDSLGKWIQQAKLSPTGGTDYDNFGHSVAVDGDTVLVGAHEDGDNVKSPGAVHVFTRNESDEWIYQTKLTASGGAHADLFGYSVALSGNTAIIGAHQVDKDLTTTSSGAAYVFTRASGMWTETKKLTASDGAAGDQFGVSVAVDGNTVVVGADGDDKDAIDTDAGAAFVFTNDSGTWDLKVKLIASDANASDWFGSSVAVDGNTIVVGAPGDDDNGDDSGSIYVYTRPLEGWPASPGASLTEGDKISHQGGKAYDQFGYSVSVAGDITLVGAPKDDTRYTDDGSVFVITRDSSGDWFEMIQLTAPDGGANDQFGYSVAVDSESILVGAYAETGPNLPRGSAYVLVAPVWMDISGSGPTTTSHTVSGLTNYQEYWFGIRAVNASGAGPASNSASATPRIAKPAKPTGLGAVAGDKKVALRWDNPNDSTISKYQISEVIPEDWLTASDGAAGDQFGVSVAVDGDTAVVGAYHGDSTVLSDSGVAYVFTKNAGGIWDAGVKLFASDGAADDQFGWSVAVDGDTIVVGAYRDDHQDDCKVFFYPLMVSLSNHGWLVWASFDKLRMSRNR